MSGSNAARSPYSGESRDMSKENRSHRRKPSESLESICAVDKPYMHAKLERRAEVITDEVVIRHTASAERSVLAGR